VDWEGTDNTLVDVAYIGDAAQGRAGPPDISDDGQVLVYPLWSLPEYGSGIAWRIWKNNREGSEFTQLTESEQVPERDCDWSRISGGGARVTFVCRDLTPTWTNDPQAYRSLTINTDGSDEQPLPRGILGNSSDPDVTPDGARAVFVSAANPMGENPDPGPQVYRVGTEGSDMFRLTGFAEGKPKEPTVTNDGSLVVFASDSDPFGLNPGRLHQIFAVQADGTGLAQLTQGVQTPDPPPPRSCNYPITPHDSDTPDISGDGSVVMFHSRADLTGQNPTHGHRIFKVAPDGSDLVQLGGADLVGRRPRIDDAGIWVAFDDGSDVRRIRTNGTGLLTLASGTHADISAAGDVITFQSDANYGSNPDRNTEIFVYTRTGGVQQVTFTSEGYNSQPRISRDGRWVYFLSDSFHFEENHSDAKHFFRVDLETGTVERVSALSPCDEETLAVNHDGSLAVFSAGLDCTGQNPDGADELHTIDRNAQPRVFVSAGTQPTVVSWDAHSGPIRYDVIRGDHANLSLPGNGTVDLGAVVCLENDSPDADTVGDEDPDLPGPGQAFFYVLRGSVGADAGPGSYGQATGGEERLPASGDCAD
jgi:Tol biopolymer transport system component